MKKNIFSVQLVVSILIFSLSFGKDNIWEAFFKNPNEKNYKMCQKQIEESLSDKYEKFKSPTFLQLTEYGAMGKLLGLIEEGNIYANELCYQLFPLFRSHGYVYYLEFFDVALGKLIKKNPEVFLLLLNKYLKRPEGNYIQMDKLLCALGDEFVDKIDKKITETEERMKALKNVDKKELEEIRDECINIFIERKNFLLKVKEELKDKGEQMK